MQEEEEDPEPPLDWKAIVGALTQAGSPGSGTSEGDYDPIARHRDALSAKPYTGDRGLYPDTSTPEGRSQYDSQLNSLVTGPLSLLGGLPGGIAGMADVEAQAGAEGRVAESWERGLGAAGVIPGMGMLRKIGKVPVTVEAQKLIGNFQGLPIRSAVTDLLERRRPYVEKLFDGIIHNDPTVSSGVKELRLVGGGEAAYNPKKLRINLDPTGGVLDLGSKEAEGFRAAGRGNPSIDTILRHEGFHGKDFSAGEGIRRLADLKSYEGNPSFLSGFLSYRPPYNGGMGGDGIRELGDKAHYIGSTYRQAWDFVKDNYPELLGQKLPEGLYEDIYSSGRRYNAWESPASTMPTEILATLAEDPEVLRNSPALQDFIAIMEDVIMKEQRRALGQ